MFDLGLESFFCMNLRGFIYIRSHMPMIGIKGPRNIQNRIQSHNISQQNRTRLVGRSYHSSNEVAVGAK